MQRRRNLPAMVLASAQRIDAASLKIQKAPLATGAFFRIGPFGGGAEIRMCQYLSISAQRPKEVEQGTTGLLYFSTGPIWALLVKSFQMPLPKTLIALWRSPEQFVSLREELRPIANEATIRESLICFGALSPGKGARVANALTTQPSSGAAFHVGAKAFPEAPVIVTRWPQVPAWVSALTSSAAGSKLSPFGAKLLARSVGH